MNNNFVKYCRVCGDSALCFNFNGLSCEACKVFFRRAMVKNQQYKCKNSDGNKCDVNKNNRKCCKKCRLDKCLEIGMKKEFISVFDENMTLKRNLPDFISEFNQNLSIAELDHIREVESAMSIFPDERKAYLIDEWAGDITAAANLSELYVRHVIKFCKSLSAFKCIDKDVQLQMLKSLCPELANVYMSFVYDQIKDGVFVIANPKGEKAIFFKLNHYCLKNEKIYETFRGFLSPMNVAMENDVTIRNLIIAQIVFRPRDNTNCQEYVRYNHSLYSYLLRKYLRVKFKSHADRKLNSIMSVLSQIDKSSQIIYQFYGDEADQGKLNPVLVELFELNKNLD